MQRIEHPLRYGTFLVILFGVIGFFTSYASTFLWEFLTGSKWQAYFGWISIGITGLLIFIIWITSSLIGLPLGMHKFRD